MLQFLLRLIGLGTTNPKKLPSKDREKDPWDDGQSYYVTEFREGLDSVAKTFLAHTRFNLKRKCAEMVSGLGGVMARIEVHGEMGCPYEALITETVPMTEETRNLILAVFPKVRWVRFKDSYGATILEFTRKDSHGSTILECTRK